MFCQNCGNPLSDDAVFCSHCGAKNTAKSNDTPQENASSLPALTSTNVKTKILKRISVFFILLTLVTLLFPFFETERFRNLSQTPVGFEVYSLGHPLTPMIPGGSSPEWSGRTTYLFCLKLYRTLQSLPFCVMLFMFFVTTFNKLPRIKKALPLCALGLHLFLAALYSGMKSTTYAYLEQELSGSALDVADVYNVHLSSGFWIPLVLLCVIVVVQYKSSRRSTN